MGGRTAEREQVRIAAAVRGYLARAVNDPSLSLSYEAIGRACRVSRGHFGRPEYQTLVGEILDARNARAAGGASGSTAPSGAIERDAPPAIGGGMASPVRDGDTGSLPALLSDADLRARIRFHIDEAHYEMLQWASLRERQGDVEDGALLLADLDRALRVLHHHAEATRPLVGELQDRLDADLGHLPRPQPAQTALAFGPSEATRTRTDR